MTNRKAIIQFLTTNCINCKKCLVIFEVDRIIFLCDNHWGQFSEEENCVCTQKEGRI